MRFRKLIALVLMAFSLMIGGCNGAREIDAIIYVITIGLDTSPLPGKVRVTYQIAIPRVLAAGQGGGSSVEASKTSLFISFDVANLAEARNLLNSSVARVPSLTHVKTIVIGEQYAQKGIGDLLGPSIRFRELRGSIFLLAVKGGTAEDYLKKSIAPIEMLASRYYETIMLSDNETGYFIRTPMHEVYKQLKSGSSSPYVTLVGINRESRQTVADTKISGEKVDEYEAGDIPRQGGNPSDVIGTALFHREKMVGTLSSEETRMLSILKGKWKRSFLIIEDPLVPDKAINIWIRPDAKPVIKGRFADGKAVFDVEAVIEGEITSIPSGINYEQDGYRELLQERMCDILQREAKMLVEKTQRLGTDPVGFGYHLRPRFGTYSEFAALDWEEAYKNAAININIICHIRRTGLMLRTVGSHSRSDYEENSKWSISFLQQPF